MEHIISTAMLQSCGVLFACLLIFCSESVGIFARMILVAVSSTAEYAMAECSAVGFGPTPLHS